MVSLYIKHLFLNIPNLKNLCFNRPLNSDMFHPDNIKNYHPKGNKVSHSVYELWNTFGGNKGLATRLRSDIKVSQAKKSY